MERIQKRKQLKNSKWWKSYIQISSKFAMLFNSCSPTWKGILVDLKSMTPWVQINKFTTKNKENYLVFNLLGSVSNIDGRSGVTGTHLCILTLNWRDSIKCKLNKISHSKLFERRTGKHIQVGSGCFHLKCRKESWLNQCRFMKANSWSSISSHAEIWVLKNQNN